MKTEDLLENLLLHIQTNLENDLEENIKKSRILINLLQVHVVRMTKIKLRVSRGELKSGRIDSSSFTERAKDIDSLTEKIKMGIGSIIIVQVATTEYTEED